MDSYTAELIGLKRGGMPPRSKKYYRPTKAGAGGVVALKFFGLSSDSPTT